MSGSANRCGGCTLCCKLFEIPYLGSPAGHYCIYCTPNVGCSIWQARPDGCRVYACLWLANYDTLDDGLRPDRCGVVFDPLPDTKIVVAKTGEDDPQAWQRDVCAQLIARLNRQGYAVITQGGGRRMFLPEKMSASHVRRELRRLWKESRNGPKQPQLH